MVMPKLYLATLVVTMFFNLSDIPGEGLVRTSEVPNVSEGILFSMPASSGMDFCGERVPLENPRVSEQMLDELNNRRRYKMDSRQMIMRANRYRESFSQILAESNIPKDFFYIALAESGLSNATSHRGAVGFWQFMEPTATSFGLEVSETVDERLHPELATEAACKYFSRSYRIFKNWSLVAASYNMGMSALSRAMKNQQKESLFELDLNAETARYLYRVISIKELFEDPAKYGIRVHDQEKYPPIPYRVVKVHTDIADLAQFARKHETSYEALKTLNPWLISDKLIVKPGKTYHIRVPLTENFRADELVMTFTPEPQGGGYYASQSYAGND